MSTLTSATAPGGVAATARQRDQLLAAAAALARHVDFERVMQELAQQVRHLLPYDGLAVALVSGDGTDPRLVFHDGFDSPTHPAAGDPRTTDESHAARADESAAASVARRLAPRWAEALAAGRVVLHRAGDSVTLTAPLTGSRGAEGALTVALESAEATQRPQEMEQVLAVVAELLAAAIERTRIARRAGDRRRLEAIGEVATGVAHEMRTPLFGISSAAQLLRFRAREDPVLERNVGRILREVERLNSLAADLLEVGRSRPPSLAPGDPDVVWDRVLEGYRGQLESRSLIVRRARPPGATRIPIDAEQLTQAFIHILENAVEAAPVESDLTLASAVLPGGAWRASLQNAGAPIPAEALPRVFDLFVSTKQGNTGVGLSIAQRVVHEHGGTIAVESADGVGTVVTVTLPAPG